MKLHYNSLPGMHWVWVVRGRVRKRLGRLRGVATLRVYLDVGGLRAAGEIDGQQNNRILIKN